MKLMSNLLLCTLLLLFACNSDSTSGDSIKTASSSEGHSRVDDNEDPNAAPINYTTLSTAYCKCAESTVSINAKLKKFMDSKDNEAFEAMLPEADKAYKAAMECCKDAKFRQSTGKVDQKKLLKPLKEACPDLPQQLMLKIITEIK